MSDRPREQRKEDASDKQRTRDRSHEHDNSNRPVRQLRSVTRAAAAIDAAYGNHPRSISRLHDDELVCILPFLDMKDLAVLVSCSRRFNGVARRERSRGVEIAPAVRSALLLARSPFNHHIASVWLEKRDTSDLHITRTVLQQLRLLPQLTKLDIRVRSEGAAAALLKGASSGSTAATLQAALPAGLSVFVVVTLPSSEDISTSKLETLAAAFLAAASNMRQLTELKFYHHASWRQMQLDALVELPLLRKLTLNAFKYGMPSFKLRQLSQLRELILNDIMPEDLQSLSQPPHSLQLETLRVGHWVGEETMRSLVRLPTLTELEPELLDPDAFPLLPQLPRLRKLTVACDCALKDHWSWRLSDALARCTALEDLTLSFEFEPADEEEDEEEVHRELWDDILRSLPNIRRLAVETGSVVSLIAALSAHLPRLERLALYSFRSRVTSELVCTKLAHPTLQQLELGAKIFCALTEEQMRSLLHSARLPHLASCTLAGALFSSLKCPFDVPVQMP
jgi:hypothetical protein